jgi:membrane peptidoglycan carboxypeptidase
MGMMGDTTVSHGMAFLSELVCCRKVGYLFLKKQNGISLDTIPQDAIDAVIVSEDGTFWTHEGFDWFEFKESIERNFEEGRAARGASTITQQLVKNLYLSSSKNPLQKSTLSVCNIEVSG